MVHMFPEGHVAKLGRDRETAKTRSDGICINLHPDNPMTRTRFIACLLLFCLKSSAQEARLPDGMWQAGTTGRISPLDEAAESAAASIRLERELVQVDLHPGFSVVKTEFVFRNGSDSSITLLLGIPSSGHYEVEGLGRCSFYGNESPKVVVNGAKAETSIREIPPGNPLPVYDSVMTYRYHAWMQRFGPGMTTITVYQTTQNHLSRLVKGERARDGNAFGYVRKGDRTWPGGATVSQMLVRLNGELYLTGIRAAMPEGAFKGNMRHLQSGKSAESSLSESNLLVWYDGAAPDFKYGKKVLGSTDALYAAMDAFPLGEFDDPGFQKVDRKNFDVSETGMTPAGIAYFIMFFLPWIILLFIIFQLLRKVKKGKEASGKETQQADPKNP